MNDYDDYNDYEEEERPRDAAIDRAIERVHDFFEKAPDKVFYSTQIETSLEREFFHWITGKALLEMGNAGIIQRVRHHVGSQTVNFYAHLKHRYYRRQLTEISGVLERIHHPDFSRAIGLQGELMFDAALGRVGFQMEARNAKTWNGIAWTETNHDLDRITVRDGLAYGIEIKNTQNYIRRDELLIKINMCKYLGVTPLFIMRFAPKSYIHEVNKSGGFVLLFEEQIYPLGHTELLADVRGKLGLKVHSPRDVKDGDVQRLLKWHQKRLKP